MPRKITFSKDPQSFPEVGGPNHPPLGDMHNLQRCRAASMLLLKVTTFGWSCSMAASHFQTGKHLPILPHKSPWQSILQCGYTRRRVYNVYIIYIYIYLSISLSVSVCACVCVYTYIYIYIYIVIEHQIPCQPVRDCTQNKIQAIQATKEFHMIPACSNGMFVVFPRRRAPAKLQLPDSKTAYHKQSQLYWSLGRSRQQGAKMPFYCVCFTRGIAVNIFQKMHVHNCANT